MQIKRPLKRRELVEVWEAFRKAKPWDSEDVLKELLSDGYYHLSELRAHPKCNPIQVNGLALQIDRVEKFLEGKKRR